MAVIVFGCGVAGLSVLAYAFIQFILILHADSYSSPRVAKCLRLAIHVLSIVVHPHAQALGVLGLTQAFSRLHEFVEHSRTPNFASSLCSVRFPPLPVRYFFPRTGISLVFTHAISSTDL